MFAVVSPWFRRSVPLLGLLLGHAVGTPAPTMAVFQRFPASAGDTRSSQAPPPTDNQLPPQVSAWIRQANALEEKGANREALNLQQKVVDWLRANPRQGEATTAEILHPFGQLHWKNDKSVEAPGLAEKEVTLRHRPEQINSGAAAELTTSLRLEAVAIHRRLAVSDSGMTTVFAGSLSILGLLCASVSRPPKAQAVAKNPAFQDSLDPALTKLNQIHRQPGHPEIPCRVPHRP